MSYKTILVQLALEGPTASTLNFAQELAYKFDAHWIAFAAAEASLAGIAPTEFVRYQVEDIGARLKVLESEFRSFSKDDPRASWRGGTDNPTALLVAHAQAADLIVVGSSAQGWRGSPIDVGALILTVGRPVLLLSEDRSPIKYDSVVVCWKATRESRRAVTDAMPFLAAAGNVVVAAVEDSDPAAAEQNVADVVDFLSRHDVKARGEVVRSDPSQPADALVQLASRVGANLMVAGGYGRNRLSEWAFGGATRSLLEKNAIHRLFSN